MDGAYRATKGPGFLHCQLHFTKKETEAWEGTTWLQRPRVVRMVRKETQLDVQEGILPAES